MILAALIALVGNGFVFIALLYELATTGRVTTGERTTPEYFEPWQTAILLLVAGSGFLTAIGFLMRGSL